MDAPAEGDQPNAARYMIVVKDERHGVLNVRACRDDAATPAAASSVKPPTKTAWFAARGCGRLH